MCNIAGYVGSRSAAPILIEMMKREEGFAGGFYSGIATVHEGKIYYAKLTGDIDRLLAETDAASLPGTIGIIHSRSKSGGGDEWAHPFVATRGGEIFSAYVANGSSGFFKNRSVDSDALAERLNRLGYQMKSRSAAVPGYPALSDGTGVHMSDLMCQLIQYHMDNGCDEIAAMDTAFHTMPGEIVGLLLTLRETEAITWSRINMPMFVGFADHGAYLASSALAFPNDAKNETLLPCLSSGKVYADRYTVVPYRETIGDMGKIDDTVTKEAYGIIESLLKEGNKTFSDLYKAIAHVFGAHDFIDREPLAYRILQAINRQGRLACESVCRPGAVDGLTAPETHFSMK
ncbi:MAG: hypothetical protein IJW49_00725 [Clostridia bacterium]|nr:hypothetical protein [Clostridia bacterium]